MSRKYHKKKKKSTKEFTEHLTYRIKESIVVDNPDDLVIDVPEIDKCFNRLVNSYTGNPVTFINPVIGTYLLRLVNKHYLLHLSVVDTYYVDAYVGFIIKPNLHNHTMRINLIEITDSIFMNYPIMHLI